MSKLLKLLFAFALPMYAFEEGGGGGGGQEALGTDNFAEMLDGEGDNEQTDDSDSQNADDDQGTDQEAAAEDDTEDAQDGDEGDDEGEQDEQPEEDSTKAFLELEIDGKKVQLSKEEVKNGYLRQQDFTQKTQTLARDRQNWQAHVQQQAAEVQQFSQELGALQTIDAQIQAYHNINWDDVRETDPLSYNTHMLELQNLKNLRGEVVTSIGQKQENLARAQKQVFEQQTQEAYAYMAKIVPGYGQKHIAEITASALADGYSAAELKNVADKRMILTLWKASQYDKSQAAGKQAVKKLAALPTKASKPAASSKPVPQLNIERQAKRLQQSGSVKDFAALLGMAPKRK